VKTVELEISEKELADAFVNSSRYLDNYLGGQPLINALAEFIREQYNSNFDTDTFPSVVGRVSQILRKGGIVRLV